MRGYFIRITPDDATMTLTAMVDYLDLTLECKEYVVSREEASRVHFHLLLYVPFSAERLRYRIKSCIEGQVYISGKDIQDKVKCIAYTIKDGCYKQKGISFVDWMQAKQVTKKKIKFEDSLKAIEVAYAHTRDEETLLRDLMDLHIKHGRKIYKHHIKSWFESIKIKTDSSYKEKVIKEILGYW